MSERLLADITAQLESQSLNAVVAGFAFASAIAWMDAVRWLISRVVKSPKNSGTYALLTALLTTLLSIFVFVGIQRVSKRAPKKMPSPVYAVTA
jgi:hypothetical protein